MGFRLSKIVTKTGDEGLTGLGDGSRVAKNYSRIEAIGNIDELNCVLGMLLATPNLPSTVSDILDVIQHDLFELGGELAVPGRVRITEAQIASLEQHIAHYNEQLPPLKEFILPGGTPNAALCHFARAVCRRAERSLVSLDQQAKMNPLNLIYLNRLSDLLFIVARILLRHEGGSEEMWQPKS